MKAGVIGLGEVGAGVALCLARAGLLGAVYDIRDDAAAGLEGVPANAASPAEVARDCDVIVIAVVSAEQTLAVLDGADGILAAAQPGTVIVLQATVSMTDLERIRRVTTAAGVGLIDAGVAAGARSAEKGIISLVGASDADYAKALPVLEGFSRYVARMGGPGAGMAAKIARNAIVMGAIRAGHEGAMLAKAAGVNIAQFTKMMEDSVDAVTGPTTITRRPADPTTDAAEMNARKMYRKFMLKDMEAGLELAATLGVKLAVLEWAQQTIDETVAFKQ